MENQVKQKQIEEMAKRECGCYIVAQDMCVLDRKICNCDCTDYRKAKRFYDYFISIGYQNLSEDSVVLSSEEYEKVKHVLKYEPEEAIIRLEDLTKNERLYNPHMFCSLAGCSGVHKGCNRTCKESWIVIERKETAEKIMNDISGDILTVNTKEYGNIEVIPVERLQEICENIIKGDKQ